jgi:hypothetical protein
VSSDRRTRIAKDSESSARRALRRGKEYTKEDRTIGCSVRRYSAKWALRQCADRHKEKNSLSSGLEEESKEKDLSSVVEHPKGFIKRFLE